MPRHQKNGLITRFHCENLKHLMNYYNFIPVQSFEVQSMFLAAKFVFLSEFKSKNQRGKKIHTAKLMPKQFTS